MSFSKPTVDQTAAKQLFQEAIAIAQDDSKKNPTIGWDAEFRTIIAGKHLTFRYILVTALLAKATNPSIQVSMPLRFKQVLMLKEHMMLVAYVMEL